MEKLAFNTAFDCRFCNSDGTCSHKDAPNPNQDTCIGKKNCDDYRKDRRY